jgi:predicted ATPase
VLAADFEDGCRVVELESVGSAADVVPAIGRTLGLPDESLVARHLRGRRVLLILDNFEQVVDAAVEVARLGARVLVTSQTPLRVRGERVIRLVPLALPDAALTDPAKLAEVPSVALLVAHARASDPSFALTDANAVDIARICVQLDGLPLALELAGARLALFGAAELSARLSAGLEALGPGPRDLPPRQRGLRAALDWTCGLLSDAELRLFLRLSVFAGGFTAALAEAVDGDDGAVDRLAALFDIALVRREHEDRYAISPPVRVYAVGRLGDGVREARVRQAEALIAFASQAEALWWTDLRASKQAFAAEAQNISEARGALRSVDPLLHARLLAGAARWFSDSGRAAECAAELDFALGRREVRGPLRARLLCRRAIAVESDDPLTASEVAVAACRADGTGRDLVEALFGLSTGYTVVGNGSRALETAREAQAIARGFDDRVARDLADLATGTALALVGRPAEALALMTLLDRRVPPGGRIAMNTTIARADTALACGDPLTALQGYGRWLRQHHALNSYFNEAFQLDGAAMALTALERFEEAVITAEISDLLRHEWTIEAPPVYRESRDAQLAPAYSALGPTGVEAARATARRLGPRHGPIWVAGHVDPAPTLHSSPAESLPPIPTDRG